jgi:hypothetical protein
MEMHLAADADRRDLAPRHHRQHEDGALHGEQHALDGLLAGRGRLAMTVAVPSHVRERDGGRLDDGA